MARNYRLRIRQVSGLTVSDQEAIPAEQSPSPDGESGVGK